jgi:uncharacterized protein YeeX (DUF496 family)
MDSEMDSKVVKQAIKDHEKELDSDEYGYVTYDELKQYVPKGVSSRAIRETVELINGSDERSGIDPEYLKKSVFSYTHLIRKGTSLKNYINALEFCLLKRIPKMTNIKAWKIVFPDRWKRLQRDGKADRADTDVAIFNATDLVVAIDKLLMIPMDVRYMPYIDFCVQKQKDLANGISADKEAYVSPHVQHLATKELYEMIKPQNTESTLTVKHKLDDKILEHQKGMADSVRKLIENQQRAMNSGLGIAEVQKIFH